MSWQHSCRVQYKFELIVSSFWATYTLELDNELQEWCFSESIPKPHKFRYAIANVQ